MAHPRHEWVRQRFSRRCGYCGVSEIDAAGELTVDHYHPVSAGGGDDDENLVYACFRCNLFKSDYTPSADDRARGRRVLHPQQDVVRDHVRLNGRTGRLEPLTETGRFHIDLLHLNRPALVEHRLRQQLAQSQADQLRALEGEAVSLRTLLALQQQYIALLHEQLGPPDR